MFADDVKILLCKIHKISGELSFAGAEWYNRKTDRKDGSIYGYDQNTGPGAFD